MNNLGGLIGRSVILYFQLEESFIDFSLCSVYSVFCVCGSKFTLDLCVVLVRIIMMSGRGRWSARSSVVIRFRMVMRWTVIFVVGRIVQWVLGLSRSWMWVKSIARRNQTSKCSQISSRHSSASQCTTKGTSCS